MNKWKKDISESTLFYVENNKPNTKTQYEYYIFSILRIFGTTLIRFGPIISKFITHTNNKTVSKISAQTIIFTRHAPPPSVIESFEKSTKDQTSLKNSRIPLIVLIFP